MAKINYFKNKIQFFNIFNIKNYKKCSKDGKNNIPKMELIIFNRKRDKKYGNLSFLFGNFTTFVHYKYKYNFL